MKSKNKVASGVIGICTAWVTAILVLGFLPLRFNLDGVQVPMAAPHRATEAARLQDELTVEPSSLLARGEAPHSQPELP